MGFQDIQSQSFRKSLLEIKHLLNVLDNRKEVLLCKFLSIVTDSEDVEPNLFLI